MPAEGSDWKVVSRRASRSPPLETATEPQPIPAKKPPPVEPLKGWGETGSTWGDKQRPKQPRRKQAVAPLLKNGEHVHLRKKVSSEAQAGHVKVTAGKSRYRRQYIERTEEEEVAWVVQLLEVAQENVKGSEFFAKFLEQLAILESFVTGSKGGLSATDCQKGDGNAKASEPSHSRDLDRAGQSLTEHRADVEGCTSCSSGEVRGVDESSAETTADGSSEKGSQAQEEVAGRCGDGRWTDIDMVVYGVGSVAGSEVSRCQLALALLVHSHCNLSGQVLVYDPVLSIAEKRALEQLGCTMIEVDEKGHRRVERLTLFYMPHCEGWLYDNVLSSNWDVSQLQMLVILGNSFARYQERWSIKPRSAGDEIEHIVKVAPFAKEVPVDSVNFSPMSAFNDMSWHFFQGSIPDALWTQTPTCCQ